MTKTIWKFPFETADEVIISMPKGAEVLTVQIQGGLPCLWAIVDLGAVVFAPVKFRIFGTGHPLPTYGPDETPLGKYVGTYQQAGGALVWHVFKMGWPQ